MTFTPRGRHFIAGDWISSAMAATAEGERAVLAIIANEHKKHGFCDLYVD
jgi:hypothetical protein